MGPPADQPSGVGTPDSGWRMSGRRGRATAALSSTTPADTTEGTTAGRQHDTKNINVWGGGGGNRVGGSNLTIESTEGVSQILTGRTFSRWAPSPFGVTLRFT